MARIRCFVSVDAPEKVSEGFRKAKQEFKPFFGGKMVESENLHITLAFLTKDKKPGVPEDKILLVKKIFHQVLENVKSFDVELVGVKAVPERRPRVLMIDVGEGKDALEVIQKELRIRLRRAGVQAKTHEPHLTLARIRFFKDEKAFFQKIKALKKKKFARFHASEVCLKKSELTPEGPVYSDLSVHELE